MFARLTNRFLRAIGYDFRYGFAACRRKGDIRSNVRPEPVVTKNPPIVIEGDAHNVAFLYNQAVIAHLRAAR